MAIELNIHEVANRPSAGLGSSLAGATAGFTNEDRRRLARLVLSGVSRIELATIALVRFASIDVDIAASHLKLTTAQLLMHLNSFDAKERAFRLRRSRDELLRRREEKLKNIRGKRIECLACGLINHWRPGDPHLCQECLQPLDSKLCRGPVGPQDGVEIATTSPSTEFSREKGL